MTFNNTTGELSIFQFHQFSGMNFRAQFQVSQVGVPLYLGGTVYVDVSCRKTDGTGILIVRLLVLVLSI